MLLAGTYTVAGQLNINNDISLESMGDVVVDGFLLFGGAVSCKDIVFINSGFTDRISALTTPDPNDLSVLPYPAIRVDGNGSQIINAIIHDTPSGILVSSGGGNGTTLYGCVVYFTGWDTPNNLSPGHNLYPANDGDANNVLTIQNCIVFMGFGWGIHNYGTVQNNITVKNCIVFKSGVLSGVGVNRPNLLQSASHVEGKSSDNLNWIGNCTYGTTGANINLWGYGSNISGILQDNYLPDGITIAGTPTLETGNIYEPEAGQRVFVFPNSHKAYAAHVACYNWTDANTIEVDLSNVTGLLVGDTVNVWNVQAGIGNDIQSLVLDANRKIVVNMQAVNRTTATPIGDGWETPVTTFPTFGAFVLEKA
jgi:hypothetical protein